MKICLNYNFYLRLICICYRYCTSNQGIFPKTHNLILILFLFKQICIVFTTLLLTYQLLDQTRVLLQLNFFWGVVSIFSEGPGSSFSRFCETYSLPHAATQHCHRSMKVVLDVTCTTGRGCLAPQPSKKLFTKTIGALLLDIISY